MPTWAVWSRKATDAEITELVRWWSVTTSSRWYFIEGPTCSDFVNGHSAAARLKDAWMFRAFGEDGDLAARRADFDGEGQWMVRVIAREAPAGDDWQRHELREGPEQALILYGEADANGRFVEGQQFRMPFQYPEVFPSSEGARTSLVVQTLEAQGGPIVRWMCLRECGTPVRSGRE